MRLEPLIAKQYMMKGCEKSRQSLLDERMYYYPVSAVLTECLILSVVEQQDSYGYEISQTVKMVASIKESTLYPILRKLETGGYLTTYSEEFQGRKRKYYSITEAGREQLEYLRKEWREYRDTIDDIVEGRLRK